jgi:hypothetical protein
VTLSCSSAHSAARSPPACLTLDPPPFLTSCPGLPQPCTLSLRYSPACCLCVWLGAGLPSLSPYRESLLNLSCQSYKVLDGLKCGASGRGDLWSQAVGVQRAMEEAGSPLIPQSGHGWLSQSCTCLFHFTGLSGLLLLYFLHENEVERNPHKPWTQSEM